jgi:hypothetical protein
VTLQARLPYLLLLLLLLLLLELLVLRRANEPDPNEGV